MDKELRLILINYFNNILKTSLRYRETYNPPIYSKDGNILFTKDEFDDLKDILVGNADIAKQVKDQLLTVLKDYYSDLISINLGFSPEGFEIILNRNPLQMLNVNPYVNIASNLDTVEQLDDFCRSNKETSKICRTKEFWRSLLKVVYPKGYKGEYNYEAAYKGYLSVLNKDMIRLSDIEGSNNVFEYVKFMINEGLITPQNYKKFIIPAIYLNSPATFGRITEYAGNAKDIAEIMVPEFYEAVRDGNVRYVSNLLDIILHDNRVSNIKNLMLDLFDQTDKFLWNINVIDILREYAKNISDQDTNWFDFVIDVAIENAILLKSEDSLNNLLNKYKVIHRRAKMWLRDIRDHVVITSDEVAKVLEDYLRSYH